MDTARLERLFRAARLHPPGERTAFLEAACPDDPALRDEVLALLDLDAEADDDGFLDRPATGLLDSADAPRQSAGPDPLVGESLGPYRVLRPLGEGGMGAVYLAVREVPFVRYVALKVVRGLASADALARFEQERQILAGLDHPGIARLLDGGVTAPMPGAPGGLPYFAMEYVEGRPLTDYADEHRLSVDDRLALFAQVCEAVHVAHQNLVLHRDLKPSNILVTTDGGSDGGPRVKLLDFGIAKLLNPTLGPSAVPVTQTALRPLTPEYASPEQVRGEGLTTASDVYSLGVVLYELLAGRRPYRIETRAPEEVTRAILDADPGRPSTRASGDAETARQRDTTPDRLQRALRGDLDTIVMKALRKEPARRYASAEALAQDLDRHREGLPVLAQGDSRRYRFAKLVRRHKAATASLVAALAVVLGFAAYSQWQAGRLETERDRAQTAQTEAAAVSTFLVGLFERADPTATPGDSVTVRELLDDGAARVETELAGQPVVQAGVLSAVARAYQNFGRPTDAVPLLERALDLRRQSLGDEHEDTAEARLALADAYTSVHEIGRVEPLYREALAVAERVHGPQSIETAEALGRLALFFDVIGQREEAVPLAARWRAILDATETETTPLAQSLTDLAAYLTRRGEDREAERGLRRALAVARETEGDTSHVVGIALNQLSLSLYRLGQVEEAEDAAREAVEIHTALFPEGHESLTSSWLGVGEALVARGEMDEGLDAFERALEIGQQVYPGGHPSVASTLGRLAAVSREAGREAEAATYYGDAADAYAAIFGSDFPTAQALRDTLAEVEGGR